MDNLITWLLQQSPAIVVKGVWIYWLQKRYTDSENEKTELAKNVIKLTVAYENKLDRDNLSDQEIKVLLIEIRDGVNALQHEK
jgi:hypothetical protein